MKALTGLAVGAIALGAIALTTSPPAQAQMGKLMDEIKAKVKNAEHAAIIHQRRSAMRQMSGAMKNIAAYVKEGKGTPAEVAAEARKVAGIVEKVPGLFPSGTGMEQYEGATGAKPVVWSDAGKFKEAAENLQTLAMDLSKKASGSDANQKTVAAAFGPVGKDGCGGCHKTFRQKLN